MDVYAKSLGQLESIAAKKQLNNPLRVEPRVLFERLGTRYGGNNVWIKKVATRNKGKANIEVDGYTGRPKCFYSSLDELSLVLDELWKFLSVSDFYCIEFEIVPRLTETWRQLPKGYKKNIESLSATIVKIEENPRRTWLQPSSAGIGEVYDDDPHKQYDVYFKWVAELNKLNRKKTSLKF